MPYKSNADQKSWYLRNSEYVKWQRREKLFGLTKADYEAILVAQNNCCAICEKPLNFANYNDVHLDHCHESNKVRGILCMRCNVGLGMLGDTEEGILKALSYIQKGSTL